MRAWRIAVACVALAGCASQPQVRVEFDRAAPFDTYRSFAFATGAAGSVGQYVEAATRRELEARGLAYDARSPQLIVSFAGAVADTPPIAVPAYPAAGRYGYRGSNMPRDTIEPYVEGRLAIRMVDATRGTQVWEGVVTSVPVEQSLVNAQPVIDGAVKAALAHYPPSSSK